MNEYPDFKKPKDRRVPTKFKRPRHEDHDTDRDRWIAALIMAICFFAVWLIILS